VSPNVKKKEPKRGKNNDHVALPAKACSATCKSTGCVPGFDGRTLPISPRLLVRFGIAMENLPLRKEATMACGNYTTTIIVGTSFGNIKPISGYLEFSHTALRVSAFRQNT
jgi:hypothetical protein